MQVAALAFMVHLGLSNAATVLAGRASGAGDVRGLRQIAIAAIGLSLVLCAIGIAIFVSAPVAIIALFLDTTKPDSPEILALGTRLLVLAALFQLGDAMQVMALGLLRAIRDTRVPMWAAAFSYWGVGIPVSAILGFYFDLGAEGIWLGLCIGLLFASTSLMARFWMRAPREAMRA
jgi:MATE family multidrug resistance protein